MLEDKNKNLLFENEELINDKDLQDRSQEIN